MKSHIKKIKRKIKKKNPETFPHNAGKTIRKPLTAKQVKKNRKKTDSNKSEVYFIGKEGYKYLQSIPVDEEAQNKIQAEIDETASLAEEKKRLTQEETDRETRAIMNPVYDKDWLKSPAQWSAKVDYAEPDLQSQLNEIQTCGTCLGYGMWALGDDVPLGEIDAGEGFPAIACPECGANANPTDDEPALDITVGAQWTGNAGDDLERALQKDFESKKKRLEEDPMEDALRQIKRVIAAGASNAYKYHGDDPQHQDWQDAEGNVLRWNPDTNQYEKIEEKPRTDIVFGVLFFAAIFYLIGLGTTIIYHRLNPSIEYRDKIKTEYSRPMELNGIAPNPFGPQKIILLPQDIKIDRKLPAMDEGRVKRA